MPQGRLSKVCIAVSLGLIAALGAGCAKRQATYVAVDPNTGQQYAVVQAGAAAGRHHAISSRSNISRAALSFTARAGSSAQAQAAPSSASATTTDDIPNRGLFTSRRSAVPVPQAQQSYVVQYQAPPVAAAPAQTYVMQQPATVVQAPARGVVAPRWRAASTPRRAGRTRRLRLTPRPVRPTRSIAATNCASPCSARKA